MTINPPFGHYMRNTHFSFSPSFKPLNHGSFGAYPAPIQAVESSFQKLVNERPDTFIVYDLPDYIDTSRQAIAPLLGVDVDEVVLIPNATTGINTVLRNLSLLPTDVVIHFSTIYAACHKTLASIAEHTPFQTCAIELTYPIADAKIVSLLKESILKLKGEGKTVRLALFDTVLTFPGARMPWEELTAVCREEEVLSLIDGAHGVGHIDMRHLGSVGVDFLVSNCHKWLYTPRSCAVFYVPKRNQHIIRTSIPTSHGYSYPSNKTPLSPGKTRFVYLFEFVATIDYTPYFCIPAALEFRTKVCGGEEQIQKYCFEIARKGGDIVGGILGTSVMGGQDGESRMRECAFVNVELPLKFQRIHLENKREGIEEVKSLSSDASGDRFTRTIFDAADADKISKWINMTAVKEFDTYLQMAFHAGFLWVRLSGQIYLELGDFEWVGVVLKGLCERVENGEVGGV